MNKTLSIAGAVSMALCAATVSAHAATSVASFDASAGVLNITGSCSGRYVIVLIKNSSSGAIWGSSNPPCESGAYSYTIAVPDSVRTGGSFFVNAMDNGVPGSGSGPSSPVIFSPQPNIDQTAPSITLDTSTLDAAPDDVSILDSILQNCFGLVTSAMNAVEASVVAATQLFAKMFTVLPGGSITVPSGQNQISGRALLEAGATDIFVANTSIASSSQVIVTPTAATQVPLAVTQIISGKGFHVGTALPQAADISFTWFILDTYPSGPQSSVTQNQSQQTVLVPVMTSTPSPAPDPVSAPDPAPAPVDTSTDVVAPGSDASSSDVSSSIDIASSTTEATTTDNGDASDTTSTAQ